MSELSPLAEARDIQPATPQGRPSRTSVQQTLILSFALTGTPPEGVVSFFMGTVRD